MKDDICGDPGQRRVQFLRVERRQLDHARAIEAREHMRASRACAKQTRHGDAAVEQPAHEYGPDESCAACHQRGSE